MMDVSILKPIGVLAGLDTQALDQIVALSAIRSYQYGEVIFEEQSDGRVWYIVLEGLVEITVDPAILGALDMGATDSRTVTRIEPGNGFGELALLDGQPRSASAICAQDDTTLLAITQADFDTLIAHNQAIAAVILQNMVVDLAAKLRHTKMLFTQQLLIGHHVRALQEEIAADCAHANTVMPLQKTIVIRDPHAFVLAEILDVAPYPATKETLDIFLFAAPHILHALVNTEPPSGEEILHSLLSLIRRGQLPARTVSEQFSYHFTPEHGRRAGTLLVKKGSGDTTATYTIRWQIKGAYCHPTILEARGHLFLFVALDEASATSAQIEGMLSGVDMPMQRAISHTLQTMTRTSDRFRILIVHHRTHEVAYTLRAIHQLGYQIDAFVGIAYGDASWSTCLMLDQASNGQYLCLKAIAHATEPSQYTFDFVRSSFLSTEAAQELRQLYADPAHTSSYMLAMTALAEYLLERSIRRCRANGERLLIYEDGAYILPVVYQIYHDQSHQLHQLIRSAVDAGIVVGGVEVTTSGERKQAAAIQANQGKALVPVLSCARDDIKMIYESIGVAEAVIQSAATALGNLGLPTFETRRIAVIGGNGAIGTRLIEKLTQAHNATAHIFAVDLVGMPFARQIPGDAFPYLAPKLQYQPLPRYVVEERCLPMVLPHMFDVQSALSVPDSLRTAVEIFLTNAELYDELALSNGLALPDHVQAKLWAETAQRYGYDYIGTVPLIGNRGLTHTLAKDGCHKRVTMLATQVVFTFTSVTRLIRSGIDTVIGITGAPAFSTKDLDAFLARPTLPNKVDELVLISGSSKDYEFHHALVVLNRLLALHEDGAVGWEEQLAWLGEMYAHDLSFLQDETAAALKGLVTQAITPASLQAFAAANPGVATAIGLSSGVPADGPRTLATFLTHKLRLQISIRKTIRPEIGSVYHITIRGCPKRLVLLADGFVVNFFASFEKGVKTEYMDPIMAMQLLGLARLANATPAIPPALYQMKDQLRAEDMRAFWQSLNEQCRPLTIV